MIKWQPHRGKNTIRFLSARRRDLSMQRKDAQGNRRLCAPWKTPRYSDGMDFFFFFCRDVTSNRIASASERRPTTSRCTNTEISNVTPLKPLKDLFCNPWVPQLQATFPWASVRTRVGVAMAFSAGQRHTRFLLTHDNQQNIAYVSKNRQNLERVLTVTAMQTCVHMQRKDQPQITFSDRRLSVIQSTARRSWREMLSSNRRNICAASINGVSP